MSDALALISGDIYDTRDAFEACLVERSLNFEAEAGFAIQIIGASEYALKVARENRQAVVNAVTNVAAIGLSLNPAKRHAYLVPRKGAGGKPQICLDISYIGLVELAAACGAIQVAQARIVRANDIFVDEGPGERPTHKCNPFDKGRGEIIGVYITAKLASGDWHTEIMSVDEVNAIRDRSEAWKSLAAGKIKSCPWSTDWEEMAKKTVAKRASKWWRGRGDTGRLDRAIEHLNTEGGEGYAAELRAPQVAGDTAFDLEHHVALVNAATTEAGLTKVYAAAIAEAAKARDGEGARRFKEIALARRAVLREANTIDMEEREAA